jgi:hypothetical protein
MICVFIQGVLHVILVRGLYLIDFTQIMESSFMRRYLLLIFNHLSVFHARYVLSRSWAKTLVSYKMEVIFVIIACISQCEVDLLEASKLRQRNRPHRIDLLHRLKTFLTFNQKGHTKSLGLNKAMHKIGTIISHKLINTIIIIMVTILVQGLNKEVIQVCCKKVF